MFIFKMDLRKCNFIILCRSISAFLKEIKVKTFPKYVLFVCATQYNSYYCWREERKEIVYRKGLIVYIIMYLF